MREYEAGVFVRRLCKTYSDGSPVGRVVIRTRGEAAVVRVHTVRPEHFTRQRDPALVEMLEKHLNRSVAVETVAEARALHKWVRVPAKKARRIMNELRGMQVDQALAALRFVPNRAAHYIFKLIASAAANASEGWGADPEELRIAELRADPGPTLKRIKPRAMGRAYRVLRRSAHLTVALQEAPRKVRSGKTQRGRASVTRA